MTALLLPLLAAIPVMAAAVTAILPSRTVGRLVTLTVPAATAVAGVALLVRHDPSPSSPARSAGSSPASRSRSSRTPSPP